jgi:putative holliday junction resolvase
LVLGRILAVDYGRKRVGFAVSDPLKMIATGLETIPTHESFEFIKKYTEREEVETIVVGYPVDLKNQPAEAIIYINPFLKKLEVSFPGISIEIFDERFTSKLAKIAMIEGGLKKKKRQDKALLDKLSAVIILQSYMNSKQ